MDNSLVIFGATVVFLGALYVLVGGEKAAPKENNEKPAAPKKEKAAAVQPVAAKSAKSKKDTATAKTAAPAPKEAAKPTAPAVKEAAKPTAPAVKEVAKPTAVKPVSKPAETKAKTATPAPAVVTSAVTPASNDLKLKKPKETTEQKEARLQRQQTAKVLKKESESSARTLTEITPIVSKPVVSADDEWELVVDKKKDRPKKKIEEPVAAPVVLKPVAPVVVKETKSVVVDSKRVGGIIGPKGATLHQIQDLTGTDIQIPRSDPVNPVAVVAIAVTGPAAGVAKAIKILTEIAEIGTSHTLLGVEPAPIPSPIVAKSDPQIEQAAPPAPKVDISTLAVKVESRKMGAIIGPKGSTLHAIQDATETEINTTTAPNADVTSVVITGPAAGVAKAGKAINELATKGYCHLLAGEGFQESHIHVPPRFLAEIIGKSGSTIRAIQENTGAKVVIPPSAPRPSDSRGADNEAPVKVMLAGPKDGVVKAKAIITQITELYYHPVTHPGVVHVNLDVPEKYFNFIIGTRGSEIKHIQNNFKVSVKIPDRNTVFQSVLVLGEHANCDNAIRYINKLITQVDAREQERDAENDKGADDEENYDEELMNRYVYSRQNKNRDDESPVATEAPVESAPAPRAISDRPPGFSPMAKGEIPEASDHGAVPLNWGPVKSTLTW